MKNHAQTVLFIQQPVFGPNLSHISTTVAKGTTVVKQLNLRESLPENV